MESLRSTLRSLSNLYGDPGHIGETSETSSPTNSGGQSAADGCNSAGMTKMSILLLFGFGAALGVLANAMARAQRHQHQFNNVSAGIIGALLGGALLPRVLGMRDVSSTNGVDLAALLLAALVSAILLATYAIVRNKIGG